MKKSFYIFSIFLLCSVIVGCTLLPSDMDQSLICQLENLVVNQNIPGAVGIALDNSSILDVHAVGLRRSDSDDAIRIDDLMFIGSSAKSMTATMIAKLVDDNVLSWDSKPADFIPDLEDSLDPAFSNITLLDLLRHRAGVSPAHQDFTSLPKFDGSLPHQRLLLSKWILSKSPTFLPGTFHYSNTGYVIAATMAESATGQGWQELMDTFLFNPIGIDAIYGWPIETNVNQPIGHSKSDFTYTPVQLSDLQLDNFRLLEPAGIVSMNIYDLAKFLQLHLRARQGNPRLLTQEAFDILHSPIDEYGCGIIITDTAKGILLRHNGSDAGSFYSEIDIAPEIDIAVAILVNGYGSTVNSWIYYAAHNVIEGLHNKNL